jgi:hypothetical protein
MGDIKLGSRLAWTLPESLVVGTWLFNVCRHDWSDFVTHHIGFIYRKAGEDLINIVKRELKDGQYKPDLPLTIEVPKSHRMRVSVHPPRPGPAYSRPGSILLPKDRVFYQLLSDKAVPIIQAKTDRSRSFSHWVEDNDSPNMFKPTRACWGELQKALAKHSKNKENKYVVKIDVANFFGSLNQHTLINVLADSGYPARFLSRLEAVLTAYTGERSSRGIIQGIYPSDLLGNFYMEPIDRFLADQDIPSARYVDDMYIFLKSVDASERLMRQLIPELRSYDLVLNEAKSVIMPKAALNTEEPDLEALLTRQWKFQIKSKMKILTQIQFQSEWEDEDQEDHEGGGDADEEGRTGKPRFFSKQ